MTSTKDWYVICTDYVQGPYTQARAEQVAAKPLSADEGMCQLAHHAERHDRKPEAAWQMAVNDDAED